jgi:hypothetical protein
MIFQLLNACLLTGECNKSRIFVTAQCTMYYSVMLVIFGCSGCSEKKLEMS